MFYRLPFPNGERMEKLQEKHKVTTDVRDFLVMLREDYSSANFMRHLRMGWERYLSIDMNVTDDPTLQRTINPAKASAAARARAMKTPTQSEDEADKVCCLQCLQHCAGIFIY